MKRPNKVIYFLANRIARIYTKLSKNHHFHNPNKIKVTSPSIVISNHTSFFDFLYVMWAYKNTPINFVVARKYYETKPLSSILRLGRTIPKSLFQTDTLAMKNMLEVIKSNGVIGIFPEGQISVTGVTLRFPNGLGKLVKKCGVNVYGVKTTGAYLMDPPWTNTKRKGRIDSELIQILSNREINELTADEIETKLYQAIYTNPYYEKNVDIFKGKNLAKDLDKLLYMCQECHSEGKIVSKGNDLICEECHSVFLVKANGRIVDKNNNEQTIEDAYNFQRKFEKDRILNTDNYEFNCDVIVESIVNSKYEIVSKGDLTVNKQIIHYNSNDSYAFSIESNQVRYVPFDNGKNFQIYRNNNIYQFIPEQPYLCTKYTIIIEVMYEIRSKEEK